MTPFYRINHTKSTGDKKIESIQNNFLRCINTKIPNNCTITDCITMYPSGNCLISIIQIQDIYIYLDIIFIYKSLHGSINEFSS